MERFVKRRTRWSHTVNGSSHTVEGCTSLLAVDMPNDGLAQGHTVVGESNASQHSIQLVMCGGQISLRGGRGWEEREEGYMSNGIMRQVSINEDATPTRHLSAHSHLYSPHTSTS